MWKTAKNNKQHKPHKQIKIHEQLAAQSDQHWLSLTHKSNTIESDQKQTCLNTSDQKQSSCQINIARKWPNITFVIEKTKFNQLQLDVIK